jgi:TrmH family RNA methyltransferase
MITSTANKQVKRVTQLLEKTRQRKKEQCYVAEGRRLLSEVPAKDVEQVFVSEALQAEMEGTLLQAGVSYEIVSTQVFKQMADTVAPQGVLAIVKQPVYTLAQVLANPGHSVLFLENIQDPGNLGTMFRTAEAAGVSGIILSPDCVDIFNPKVIRSTMGAIYRVPFVIMELAEAITAFKQAGGRIYAAHLKGEKAHYDLNLTGKTGFLIGNEGNGLTKETADRADAYLRIPMEGKTESLNAAIAAALLMYEAKRQNSEKK